MSKIYWPLKWIMIKMIWNSHALFYFNILTKVQHLFIFVFSTESKELLNKHVICYFDYLKSIFNDDSFKEYIKPLVSINLKHMP